MAPPLPQALVELPAWQVLPWQQPLEQVLAEQVEGAVHLPLLHDSPLLQATQVLPPVPQAVTSVPALHWPLWQQPVAQLEGVQVTPDLHTPATQDWPLWQGTQVPPALPQADESLPE